MCTEIIKKLTPHPTIPTDAFFPILPALCIFCIIILVNNHFLKPFIYRIHFNLKLIGIEIHTPTDFSLAFAGLNLVFLIASIAASSNLEFGIPFDIFVSVTLPFSSTKTCTITVPSIPASFASLGYFGRMGVSGLDEFLFSEDFKV